MPVISFLKGLFPVACHDRIVMVGGTVRDMLLGRKCNDLDLVAALGGDELLALGFRLVEASSGADIYFRHHPDFGKIEITRIESMDVLESDLRRRDFTINAIAMAFDGSRRDPLKGGVDLAAGVLRSCSTETFTHDPLRIFRAFRFECDGWRMTADTEQLIRRQERSACFAGMPVERFSNELLKALMSKAPERFFERMIDFNSGLEFLPELFRMPSIPAGPLLHHPEGDLFTHSVQVLQRLAAKSDDCLARFCAFFHDLGKLATAEELYPKHHGHGDAGFEMAGSFCKRLCLPAAYGKGLAWISRLHGKANLWDELRDSTKVRIAEQAVKAGITHVLPLVSAADKPGGAPLNGWDMIVTVAGMNTRELGIDQDKLENMPIGDRPSFILQKRVEALRRMVTEVYE
jgi:tRNA nucleotidyltransferase (CCA-adding enzyme)